MTEISFQLIQRPDGKWMLSHGPASYGPFESPASGEEAIKRICNPTIRHYDPNGDLIK